MCDKPSLKFAIKFGYGVGLKGKQWLGLWLRNSEQVWAFDVKLDMAQAFGVFVQSGMKTNHQSATLALSPGFPLTENEK